MEGDTVAADTLTEGFVHALETEWLSVLAEADNAEEVMAGLAVEVARRLDRVGEPEPAGVDPVSGDVMERENMTVGFKASRWLRQRISRPWRGLVYREVLRQVRLQVGQEARHLRRLHMALGAFEMMQVEDGDGNPTEEDRATIHREVKELVDDLIVWVSQGMRLKRTVLEMLQGSGSASSSAPAEQPHDDVEELQRLRWWLNVLLEGDYLPTPLGAPQTRMERKKMLTVFTAMLCHLEGALGRDLSRERVAGAETTEHRQGGHTQEVPTVVDVREGMMATTIDHGGETEDGRQASFVEDALHRGGRGSTAVARAVEHQCRLERLRLARHLRFRRTSANTRGTAFFKWQIPLAVLPGIHTESRRPAGKTSKPPLTKWRRLKGAS